jgi:hypothetical protein
LEFGGKVNKAMVSTSSSSYIGDYLNTS